MKTYGYNDILTLAYQYGKERNLTGKLLTVGVRRESTESTPLVAYGNIIRIDDEGYNVIYQIGEPEEAFGHNYALRIQEEDGEGNTLIFEVSPEGHLRLIGATDSNAVNLFTFRHEQELLESSGLAITLLSTFSDMAEEAEVHRFVVELQGTVFSPEASEGVTQTFIYTKDDDVQLYLSDDEDALLAFTQAILESYFEPIVLTVYGFDSLEQRTFERDWVLSKGRAKDEEGKEVEVPEDVLQTLKSAAEEAPPAVRGKMDPKLTKEEEQVLDAVFDRSQEQMHRLTLMHKERGLIADTAVDAVSRAGKTHIFVEHPDALTVIATTSDEDIVLGVTHRGEDGLTAIKVYTTGDYRELTQAELDAF